MNRKERLAKQAAIERDWDAQQQQRQERHVPIPATDSPQYCPVNMRGHRHYFIKRRCIHCYRRLDEVTPCR